MPPDNTPFDPQRILEVLARHQVQCVVIGGYAAVLAGIDIVTRDIDITPRHLGILRRESYERFERRPRRQASVRALVHLLR